MQQFAIALLNDGRFTVMPVEALWEELFSLRVLKDVLAPKSNDEVTSAPSMPDTPTPSEVLMDKSLRWRW